MNYILLRTIQLVLTISLIPSIIYLIYLNNSYYYIITLIFILLISKIGASIGQHRYFTHKSFKTSIFKENLMALLAVLSTTGSTIEYVSVHRYHHANSDNDDDIHSPMKIGWWRSFFHWYEKKDLLKLKPAQIKDLLKNKFIVFTHKYYFLILLSYILTLIYIDINLLFFCYIIPAGLSWWSSGVLSLPLHLKTQGYRNFETSDHTVNSHLWNLLTLGEGLHNNHHAKPNEYNFAFTKKRYEWDLSPFIIDNFLK